MKILIANQDRTKELAERFSASARVRPDRLHSAGRMPELTALRLGEARSEDEFLDLFTEHLRRQHGRFAEGYEDIAGRPGITGRMRRLVRQAVARLTLAREERVLARQGLLTELLLSVMELQQERHRRDMERLERRLTDLEVGSGAGDDAGSEP